jgi:hypothetical protein
VRKRALIIAAGVVVVIVAVGIFSLLSPRPNSKFAADRALRRLQMRVDVDALSSWAQGILSAENPEEAFKPFGSAVPGRVLKRSGAAPPSAEFVEWGNGLRAIVIDRTMGGWATFGIGITRTNAHFPDRYRVFALRPGVYYFFCPT